MNIVYNTPESYLNAVEGEFQESPSVMANELGVHPSHLYNYYSGSRGVSPALRKALRQRGLLAIRIRSQITWRSEQHKIAMFVYIKKQGYDNLREYLNDIAEQELRSTPIGEVFKP